MREGGERYRRPYDLGLGGVARCRRDRTAAAAAMLADDGFHIGVLYRGVRLPAPAPSKATSTLPDIEAQFAVHGPDCRRRGRLIRWPQRRENRDEQAKNSTGRLGRRLRRKEGADPREFGDSKFPTCIRGRSASRTIRAPASREAISPGGSSSRSIRAAAPPSRPTGMTAPTRFPRQARGRSRDGRDDGNA